MRSVPDSVPVSLSSCLSDLRPDSDLYPPFPRTCTSRGSGQRATDLVVNLPAGLVPSPPLLARTGSARSMSVTIGNYWTRIEGYQDRGVCPLCNEVEDMEHILIKCKAGTRKEAWRLVNKMWAKRHQSELLSTLGGILGCGLASFTTGGQLDRGKNRLYRILMSEMAYLVWKLRNKCRIRDGEGPVQKDTEVSTRWTNTLNKRLTTDRMLTNEVRFQRNTLDGKLVKSTWTRCLRGEEGLLSEPVLTPFRSIPIRNLITLSPSLTSISLYRFQYLHSGSARPISSRYSLDFVVRFLVFRFGPSLDLFVCLLLSRDLPRYVSRRTQFPLWTLVAHVPMSPSLPPFVLRVFVLSLHVRSLFVTSLMFPCFNFACLPHVPTRSYVYCTPRRTYSYIRNSPVYCRLQD